MRLTAQQQAAVRETVLETFGADARVRLFGSRADDNKRGGDMSSPIPALRLQDAWRECERNAYHLRRALNLLHPVLPLADWLLAPPHRGD